MAYKLSQDRCEGNNKIIKYRFSNRKEILTVKYYTMIILALIVYVILQIGGGNNSNNELFRFYFYH